MMGDYIKTEIPIEVPPAKTKELLSFNHYSATFKSELVQDNTRVLQIKHEPLDDCMKIESDDVDNKPKLLIGEELDIKDEASMPQTNLEDADRIQMSKDLNFECQYETAQETCLKDSHTGSACEYKYSQNGVLHHHMEMHSSKKAFECYTCAYKTFYKAKLKQHLRIHTGETTFQCNICKYKSARKDHLKSHVKTHTGEKPFRCNVCNYECIQKGRLQEHMKIHTGEKPFQCNICKYKCTRKNSLKLHMNVHTGDKPFQCTTCEFKCSDGSNLKKHMKIHTGEKPFNAIHANLNVQTGAI